MPWITRRSFLKGVTAAGLAGAGLCAPQRSARAATPKRKFTMDLACGMIGVRVDPLEAIALAHRFGFESVAPSTGFLVKLSDAEMQDLLADLKAKKLVWGTAGLPVNFRRDEAAFKSDLENLPELAKGLQRAGVTRVATWITPGHNTLDYQSNFRLHAGRLRQVAGVLADHGQRLGLEYVGPKTSRSRSKYPFIHNMAQMKELIFAIGRDNVGLLLDSWHWYTAGETAADLRTLANRDVVACHLNDAPAGIPVDRQIDSRRELPCATGVIDLKAYLGALVQIGYDGPVQAEPFSKALGALPKEDAVAATAAAMKKAFALIE